MTMSFPNETPGYRAARNAILAEPNRIAATDGGGRRSALGSAARG